MSWVVRSSHNQHQVEVFDRPRQSVPADLPIHKTPAKLRSEWSSRRGRSAAVCGRGVGHRVAASAQPVHELVGL